jgi:hypothetical protein
MFAIYPLQNKEKSDQYLGISPLYLNINYSKRNEKIQLDNIAKIILEKRRKLAPLVLGGIITSFSLLSIFLYSSSLEMVMLVGFGLLLTYFGLFEYAVVHIEHGSSTTLLWLPVKVNVEDIRPFIAIIEFYVTQKRFPLLYASAVAPDDAKLIHYESHPVKAHGTIIYQFAKIASERVPQIAINPAFLDAPVIISAQGKVIGEGNHLINQEALISGDTISQT